MRYAIVLFTLLAASLALAQGWHWQNPRVSGNTINSTGSFGNSTVWASGYGGDLLWSTDSGQNWAVRCRASAPANQTIFVDELHGWGITTETWNDTNRACILATTDGGFTWRTQYASPNQGVALYDADFADVLNGWVAGVARLLHTTDGGQTWTNQVPDSIFPSCVSFISAQEGWFVGHRYDRSDSLYHTTDAGATWAIVPSACPAGCCPKFLDSSHGWAMGTDGMFHTTDGGVTWNPWGLVSGMLMGFDCRDDNTVSVVSLAGNIFETLDAGGHWTMQQPDSLTELYSVHAADADHIWAAGCWGKIFHTSDGGSHWGLQNGNQSLNGDLEAVDFSDLRNGWAVGGYASNVVAHTSDGGMTWAVQDSGHNGLSVSTVDSVTAWVVTGDIWSEPGSLRHTINGGISWSTIQPAPHLNLLYVTHFGPNDVWAVSLGAYNGGSSWCDSAICHSSDGGGTWACQPVAEDGWVTTDMTFMDPNRGWRIGASSGEGNEGAIFHTEDGGQTWMRQHQSYLGDLEQISFADTLHGWAAGNYGGLIRTTDGGATWDTITCPLSVGMTGVQFFDTLNGWAFSRFGYTYRSSDGGSTWQTIPMDATVGLSAMDFIDLDHGWVVGDHGSVLNYDATTSASKPRKAPLPQRFSLSIFPNPFNPTAILSFDVPAHGRVQISIYDLTGRLVKTLADRVYQQGNYRVEFDGSELASGIYFARLQGSAFSKTQKLILLK